MGEKLVVFDLDGTLVRSVSLDAACFVRAFQLGFGLVLRGDDWSRFEHVTDEGISRDVLRQAFGDEGLAERVARHRSCFVAELRRQLAGGAEAVATVPGAGALLEALRQRSDWSVAVATGGWGESARLKLDSAGLDLGGAALATSDDAVSRIDILATAVARATAMRGAAFERTISVGDAVWDVAAARSMGLPFVGVAADVYGSELRRAGVCTVLTDFLDLEGVLASLSSAVPPLAAG